MRSGWTVGALAFAALAWAAAEAGAQVVLLEVSSEMLPPLVIEDGAEPPPAEPETPVRRSSPLRERIVREAKELAGKRIAYHPRTNGGRKGCAQVASTILRRAGAIARIRLSVRDVVKDLYGHGWEKVNPPPYEDGDVITWQSYDRDGDGRKDPDTHIGVVVKKGGTTYVVDNSTAERRVKMRELSAMPYPVSRVMRKDGGDAVAD